jgi:hypothetical protein
MLSLRAKMGCLLIAWGIWIIPGNVRHMVRGILMYHVPGALTEDEKREVRAAKRAWSANTKGAVS